MSDTPDESVNGTGDEPRAEDSVDGTEDESRRPAEADDASTEATPGQTATQPAALRRRKRRNPRIWWAVGALLIVALVVWQIISAVSGGSSTAQYTTTQAEKGTLVVAVDGSGFLYAAKTASVSPKVSGTVSGLHVATGRAVTEGDVLFYVENEDLDTATTRALASYRQSKQAVEQADVQLMQAEQELEALEDSESSTRTPSPSEDDLEIAREKVDAAEEGLSAARTSRDADYEAYEKAIRDQDSRTVTAPMDGIISEVNLANGDSVSSGSTSIGTGASSTSGTSGSTSSGTSGSTTSNQSSGSSSSSSSGSSSSAPIVISDMSSLYVQVPVNEVDVTSVRRKQKATVTFDALPHLTITGKVGRISPGGTNTQGVVTFNVNVGLDVQNRKLKPGMTANASIITAVARDAVLVPIAAVQTTQGASYIRVLPNASGAGTPTTVTVKTGLTNDTMIQISSGLKSGQYVVTGQRVTTTNNSSSGGFGMPGIGGGQRSSGSSGGSSGGGSSGGAPSGPPD